MILFIILRLSTIYTSKDYRGYYCLNFRNTVFIHILDYIVLIKDKCLKNKVIIQDSYSI